MRLSLLLPLLLAALAVPATACERHLHGHQTNSDTGVEANQR
jgi:hypothetical protein